MMRVAEESRFTASDGFEIFYRRWPPTGADLEQNGAIVLLHRGHEHSGRLQHLVDELDLPGFAMFAWDARGHGLSRNGNEDNPKLCLFVDDLEHFVRHISITNSISVENVAVIGQSVGAVLAAAWVHDYAPKIRCLILATPAFRIKLYVPFARLGLTLAGFFFEKLSIKSYVKAGALTHDPARIASYKNDPLIQRQISVRVLLGLYTTAERIIADAGAIQTPTQLLISGKDWVVYRQPQDRFFEQLGSTIKERHVFAGFYHDTLGEKDRRLPLGKAREFLIRMFSQAPAKLSQLDADRRGYTRQEFESLKKPLPLFSLKGMGFALTRLAMKTGGRLSNGIRLGLETGFDSGSTLDYVYRAQPAGFTPIGKLIDWSYLNSIGWRGIRVRKANIEILLGRAMSQLRRSKRPVRVIDIAAGHGRYLLEAMAREPVPPDSALLRDYSEVNMASGRQMIHDRKMEGFARFEHGDAFDRSSLSGVNPRPTLGVVSGLYELFPDNSMVRESLAGLADAIEPGGFLVYTGQPWHPQLEMIARVLSSHRNHQPWIMRRRTQSEMDELVEAAGFRKISQIIDEWGIFTVSLAERVRAGDSLPD